MSGYAAAGTVGTDMRHDHGLALAYTPGAIADGSRGHKIPGFVVVTDFVLILLGRL